MAGQHACHEEPSSGRRGSREYAYGSSTSSMMNLPQNPHDSLPSIEQHTSTADTTSVSTHSLVKSAATNCGSGKEEQQSLSLQEASTRLLHGQPICLHIGRLQEELKDAFRVPPIDQEGRSIRYIKKFLDDIQIRHDLNFDGHIVLSTKSDPQRLDAASRYFSAITFELVYYITRRTTQNHCICSRESWVDSIKPYLGRLPDFFRAIRNVTKVLIRSEHSLLVDQAFDVDQLMSGLENGFCNLLPLTNWLGDILKQSCSPLRDTLVDEATSKIRAAMESCDAGQLAIGLSKLFDIFHIMELDIVNHQLRMYLPPRIDESTEFVRQHYKRAFEEDQVNYKSIWKWFHEQREFHEAEAAFEHFQGVSGSYGDNCGTSQDEDFLTGYTNIVFEEIVKNRPMNGQSPQPVDQLPTPFQLDYTRIQSIQQHLDRLQLRQCQVTVLNMILKLCKATNQPSIKQEQDLLQRLQDIGSFSMTRSDHIEAAAIEIVKTAYLLANKSDVVPDRFHVFQAREMLDFQTQAGSRVLTMVKDRLHELVHDELFEEVNNSITDLLPSQILERYRPFNQPHRKRTGQISSEDLKHEIESIARKLAHITIIQYRVWAQILFFKSKEAIFASGQEYLVWRSEVRRRIAIQLRQMEKPWSGPQINQASRSAEMLSSMRASKSGSQSPDSICFSDSAISEQVDHSESMHNGGLSLTS